MLLVLRGSRWATRRKQSICDRHRNRSCKYAFRCHQVFQNAAKL